MSKNETRNTALTENDLRQIRAHDLTPEAVEEQLELFALGFPPVKLQRPCTSGDGIEMLGQEKIRQCVETFEAAAGSGRCGIFVPASGAASRMFKSFQKIYNRDRESENATLNGLDDGEDEEAVRELVENLSSFAFYEPLTKVIRAGGHDPETLVGQKKHGMILKYLLTEAGLNYGNSPKGLILFHRYPEGPRSPFAEHLNEAAAYLADSQGIVRMHFTVPSGWEKTIEGHVRESVKDLESKGLKFETDYSVQQPSTDTIAVDMKNLPFRESDGSLVFRPGGHGALLKNLDERKGDIVFIKNIDNVLPDDRKETVVLYKKVLGGYLLEVQKTVFAYLEKLSSEEIAEDILQSACDFVREKLGLRVPEDKSREDLRAWLKKMFNRPIRVCGMVKNEGEPGGGPFWVSKSGQVTRQIVEKSQVNTSDEEQKTLLKQATHFNPVDLVCGVRDYKNHPFQLEKFVDRETGFISVKSKDGKELKAMERPGLWNGAMAEWITFFVEVPVDTFGPVKTVNDLLREKHRTKEQ